MTSDGRMEWILTSLKDLERRHLRRDRTHRLGCQSVCIETDGHPMVNFSSNDYLSLANDPRLIEEIQDTIHTLGWGSGASPLVTGRSPLHEKLEEELAQFKHQEAALLFPSGFAANAGAISALVDKEDLILSDAKNHASIIDGCRLSGAEVVVYPHGDIDLVNSVLRHQNARRRLIVTDGLFSMDGDVANMTQLAVLAQKYDAMLMVDEAHSTGVFGASGCGVSEQQGVHDQVDIHVGTLSKAFGCHGGFISGKRTLIEWLFNRARSFVFSTAAPAANCAAALAALEIIRSEPQRRTSLLEKAKEFRRDLQADGWDTGDSCSQIIPIRVGQPEAATRLSSSLQKQKMLVPAIRPPSVPNDESMLRISLCHDHTPEMLSNLRLALRHGKDRDCLG